MQLMRADLASEEQMVRICSSKSELDEAARVISQMYKHLSPAETLEGIRVLQRENWQVIGLFDGDSCIAAASFRFGYRLYCGEYVQIENVVVDSAHRANGAGKILVDWVKRQGKAQHCAVLLVDSTVENSGAHKFFMREGSFIRGYHMQIPLNED